MSAIPSDLPVRHFFATALSVRSHRAGDFTLQKPPHQKKYALHRKIQLNGESIAYNKGLAITKSQKHQILAFTWEKTTFK